MWFKGQIDVNLYKWRFNDEVQIRIFTSGKLEEVFGNSMIKLGSEFCQKKLSK